MTKKKLKKRKVKRRRKKPVRLPVPEVEVRRLGLQSENVTTADAEIKRENKRLRRTLAQYLKGYPELKEAWERGRFLRNLRELARTAVSVTEAARKLGLASGQTLREMLDNDIEVADIWEQTRLDVFVEAKAALVEAAKDGNQAAIRAVEGLLRDEQEHGATFDLTHITTAQLVELTGRTRQTVHDWHTKYGLRRNTDKTFDLHEFFVWFEAFTEHKSGQERLPQLMTPLQEAKNEQLRLQIAKEKNQLLPRLDVMAGIIARYQRLASARRKIDDLAMRCAGQSQQKITDECEGFLEEIIQYQGQDFEELRLPDKEGAEFVRLLESLNTNVKPVLIEVVNSDGNSKTAAAAAGPA